jgi:signal transduction histidine kinase
VNQALPIWRRLHVRMTLWVVLCLLGLGAALLWWTEHSMVQRQDAYTQWQSLGLARYIADRQPEPLIDAQGRARPALLDSTAMYAGMIQPSLEIYLLDRSGRILHHTLGKVTPRLTRVDLAAVEPLLRVPAGPLPVYGDDPNAADQPNLVSIAALPSAEDVQGYLYVVLRGQQAQRLQRAAGQSHQQQTAWRGIAMIIALAALAIVVVQTKITRRLRDLAASLSRFRQPEGDQAFESIRGARDELDQVAQAAAGLQQRVISQFQRLEEAERMRRDLISNISHDLHTPLANIQGYVETLLLQSERLSPGERKQYLETTLQHCRRLGRRVGELFELSKLESGRATLHPEPFCIAELLSDVAQSYQIKAAQRGVQLRLADNANLSVKVLADIGLIERVLQNLIDNALRHTPEGGRVELTVQADGEKVQVRVRDNGEGIAASDLPHVFERYWTTRSIGADASSEAGSAAGGSGIGLAIVRRILELHDSAIAVSSGPSEGTEFRFALPVSSG